MPPRMRSWVAPAERMSVVSTVRPSRITVVESAIANAEHNEGADVDELKVSAVCIDEGPTQKRFRARAKGRANRILKRTSHITVVVEPRFEDDAAPQRAGAKVGTR